MTLEVGPRGELSFPVNSREQKAIEEFVTNITVRLNERVEAWRMVHGYFPTLNETKPHDLPSVVDSISATVATDEVMIREIFDKIRHPTKFPLSKAIGPQSVYFRWVQIELLAALDHVRRYGPKIKPGKEKLLHEILDLEYTILAALSGGLATHDASIEERFRLLRPDGRLIRASRS